jgi:plastocyanin
MSSTGIRIAIISALISTISFSSPVIAATVAGHVQLDTHGGAGGAVVYLEGAAVAKPLTNAVVDQRNRAFEPHISVVTTGTTVQFPNDDTVFHNVFAYFHAKRFDLGMYPRGVKKTVTFDKPGVVALLCNVHPDMSAYIMVVSTPYYAVAGKDGAYEIKDVPPGTYTLHAWHESGQTSDQTLTVEAADESADVTLKPK